MWFTVSTSTTIAGVLGGLVIGFLIGLCIILLSRLKYLKKTQYEIDSDEEEYALDDFQPDIEYQKISTGIDGQNAQQDFFQDH